MTADCAEHGPRPAPRRPPAPAPALDPERMIADIRQDVSARQAGAALADWDSRQPVTIGSCTYARTDRSLIDRACYYSAQAARLAEALRAVLDSQEPPEAAG